LAAVLGVLHVADVTALRARLDTGSQRPSVIVDATGWRGSCDEKEPAIELASTLK
jgi:hypothetical protein